MPNNKRNIMSKTPHTRHWQYQLNCKSCDRIKTKKQAGLIKAEMMRIKHNSIHKELKPFIKAYHKALKEIWSKPISGKYIYARDDILILEKHGLVSTMNVFKKRGWDWNWELKELNKQMRIKRG